MSRHGQGPLSRFGLAKNFVHTERTPELPRSAEPWLAARDDFDGMLFDTLDALKAGLIDRKTFDREKARIMIARRRAALRLDQAVARALNPPRPSPARWRR